MRAVIHTSHLLVCTLQNGKHRHHPQLHGRSTLTQISSFFDACVLILCCFAPLLLSRSVFEDDAEEEPEQAEGETIDPSEPRYCICNRVSFGEMIGCDNDNVSYSPACHCSECIFSRFVCHLMLHSARNNGSISNAWG